MGNITLKQYNYNTDDCLSTYKNHNNQKCVLSSSLPSLKSTVYNAIGDNLNRIKIDSLRIRIPYKNVKIVAKDFMTRVGIFVYDTGEILDDKHISTKKLSESDDGVGVSYAYVRHMCGFNKVESYVTIGVSAKVLKQNYFDGINLDNIQQIVNYINADGVVYIALDAILSAFCADVDFCIDRNVIELLAGTQSQPQADKLDVISIVQLLHKMTDYTLPQDVALPKPRTDKGNNVGIQWSKRELVGRSYHSRQYLKLYAKLIELNSEKGSKSFTDTYLRDTDLNKYNSMYFFRYETTIKDKRHFKTYGVDVTTLRELLELDLQKVGMQFFERPASFYLNITQPLKLPKKKKRKTPTDKLLLTLIAIIIKNCIPDYLGDIPEDAKVDIAIAEIIRLTFGEEETKQCKSYQRIRLKKLAMGQIKFHLQKLENIRFQVLKDLEIINHSVLAYDSQH